MQGDPAKGLYYISLMDIVVHGIVSLLKTDPLKGQNIRPQMVMRLMMGGMSDASATQAECIARDYAYSALHNVMGKQRQSMHGCVLEVPWKIKV